MDIRTVKLTVHILRGSAYWVVSVDRGRGKRFIIARGLLEDLEEPGYAPLSLIVSEASHAALHVLRD